MKTITFLFLSIWMLQYAQAQNDNKPYQLLSKKIMMATFNPFNTLSAEFGHMTLLKYEHTLGKDVSTVTSYYNTSIPESTLMTNLLEAEEAMYLEVITAKKMGIDAFKIQYSTFGSQEYKRDILTALIALINTTEKKNIDFKFCLEFVIPRNKQNQKSEEELMNSIANDLNTVYSRTKLSDKWLRTKAGKIIFFTTNTQNISTYLEDKVGQKYNKQDVQNVARWFQDLHTRCNFEIMPVYHLISWKQDINEAVAKNFKAITHTLNFWSNENKIDKLKRICAANNVSLIPHIALENLTSELRDVDTGKRAVINKDSKTLATTYLSGSNTKMTNRFRRNLEKSVDAEVSLLNIESWNRYFFASHLAPEIHHGYAMKAVLEYYKNRWNGLQDPVKEEMAYVAYKNFFNDELVAGQSISIKYHNKKEYENFDNYIEVVTLLKEPADVYINKKYIGQATSGIQEFYVPKVKGKIQLEVKRGKSEVINYSTPKAITGFINKFDPILYINSTIDQKYSSLVNDMFLDLEMKKMHESFLLNTKSQEIWRLAAKENFLSNRKALLEFGDRPKVYFKARDKNIKHYQSKVKPLLDDFQFDVWLEMEEEKTNNKGIDKENIADTILKDYNILEESTTL
ncbi:hypothetical protein [Flammeovirga sp. SubArs3]|uniref:hypothetical protein n=1 Tax=Flammeovirga sp. SubArs3 TaxID=2995316 RepID=UPI00248C7FA5|nr:hypothetical protein [Flammeovirga sp. SubArs3]